MSQFLVIRLWQGLQHKQIVHDDLGATIKAEIKEGRARAIPITETQADIGLELLVPLLRLRGIAL